MIETWLVIEFRYNKVYVTMRRVQTAFLSYRMLSYIRAISKIVVFLPAALGPHIVFL